MTLCGLGHFFLDVNICDICRTYCMIECFVFLAVAPSLDRMMENFNRRRNIKSYRHNSIFLQSVLRLESAKKVESTEINNKKTSPVYGADRNWTQKYCCRHVVYPLPRCTFQAYENTDDYLKIHTLINTGIRPPLAFALGCPHIFENYRRICTIGVLMPQFQTKIDANFFLCITVKKTTRVLAQSSLAAATS